MSSDPDDEAWDRPARGTRKPARCGLDGGETPRRRDTSLKYQGDLTDVDDPHFPNLTTILQTVGWTLPESDEVCRDISAWWQERPESKPACLRADKEKAMLADLIEHLSAKYQADLEGKSSALIESLFTALIGRVLQRERRRMAAPSKKRSHRSIEDEATDDAGDPDPLAPATPSDGRMQAPPPPSTTRGNLVIQTRRTDEAGTFVRLASQIAHRSGSASDAADILQRLSLDELQDYLKVKTGLSVNFDLSTLLESDTVDITDDGELVAMAVHAAETNQKRLYLSCRPRSGITAPPPSSLLSTATEAIRAPPPSSLLSTATEAIRAPPPSSLLSTATESIRAPPPSSLRSTATESPSTPPPKKQKIEPAAPNNPTRTPDQPAQHHRVGAHDENFGLGPHPPPLNRPRVLPSQPRAPSSFTPVNRRPQEPSCRTPRDDTLPFTPAARTALSSDVATGHDSDLRPRSSWDRLLDRTLAAFPQPHRPNTDGTDREGASSVGPDRQDTIPPQAVDAEMDWGLQEGSPTEHISDASKDPDAVAGDNAAEPTLEEARSPNPAVDVARKDPGTPPKEVGSRGDDQSRFDEPKPRSLNVGPDRHPGAEGEPTTEDVATGVWGGEHDDTGPATDEVIFLEERSLDGNVITYGPAVRQGWELPEPSQVGDEGADGGGGVDEDDSDLAERLGNVAVHVTDHINDPGRWQDCCRFFGLDPDDHSTAAVTKFRGLRLPFLPYQVFGIFVMYEMEMFQSGGFLADEMGLGKTAEAFGLLALNRSLLLCRREVGRSREDPALPPHLPAGEQSPDARCPQGYKYGFECYCLDRSYAHRFAPTRGPNLAVVPAAVILNWQREACKWVEPEDPVFGPWHVLVAYGKPGPVQGLEGRHAALLADPSRSSAALIITTPGCLAAHVTDPHRTVAWARVVVDEAHLNSGPSTQLVRRIQAMKGARKWFLSGTPVESSPKQLAGWVATLQTDAWSRGRPTASRPRWARRDEYQATLAACTQSALKKLGSAHEGIIRKQVDTGSQEVTDHVRKLSAVVRTLYLKRSATESLWFGKPLTDVPVNHHQEICIRLAPRLVALVDRDMARINEAVLRDYRTRVDAYNASRTRRLVEEPKVNMRTFFNSARRSKIVTSYPMLASLADTVDLDYTYAEMAGCMSVQAGHLYTHAVREDCPYNANIRAICARRDCPKVRVLDRLLKGWPRGEKAVICASSPASAYILYLVGTSVAHLKVTLTVGQHLRRKHSPHVALFTQKFDKPTLHKIVQAFHDQPEALAKYAEERGPQYIVGTTKLIGIGIDLTAAVRLIQFEPEWNERDHAQARKRINRIGQASETHTYALHTTNGKVEHMIFDRHARRLYMNDLALKPDRFADADISTFDGMLNEEDGGSGGEGPVA